MDTKTRHDVTLPTGHLLFVYRGDIAAEAADAVVNAANNQLLHTAGVAGALARAGGPAVERESRQAGWVDTGSVAVTSAGRLKARFLIHAVGPRWNEHAPDEADRLLASAVTAALEAARERSCLSIAFPAVASGTFSFPADRCARVMVGAAVTWATAHPADRPRYVRFVLFDPETETAFREAVPSPPEEIV
jgi:O-acetyl-ADP-ribose deacetylase (regulator of RNase III)